MKLYVTSKMVINVSRSAWARNPAEFRCETERTEMMNLLSVCEPEWSVTVNGEFETNLSHRACKLFLYDKIIYTSLTTLKL